MCNIGDEKEPEEDKSAEPEKPKQHHDDQKSKPSIANAILGILGTEPKEEK